MNLTRILATSWLVMLLIAPVISPHNPRQTDPERILQSPDTTHYFGTDNLGRDVFTRTLYGGRNTILLAASATLIAILPALVIAIITTNQHPLLDSTMRIVLDALLAFPSLLLALAILALFGRGFVPLAIATGLAQLPYFLLIVRSSTFLELAQPYVLASEALGATRRHIVWRHILPNIWPTLRAYSAVTFAYCIVNSAALSLLGLGGDPSIPDWGVMLASGRDAIRHAPWAILAPAIAISVTIMLINRVIDDMR